MKKKILLLHGALGSKKQLQPVKKLLQETHEVLSLDFDGHGDSTEETEFSIRHFAKNVIDYLDKLDIEKIDVFGYSMGGYVAMYVAKDYPKLINRIVTLGTKLDWSKESAKKEVNMLNPDIIEAKVPHFAKKLKDEHTRNWKTVMRGTAEMMLGLADGKKLSADDFKSIQHEITIGIGNQDKMVSIAESEQVANLLPNATLTILENVVHPIDKIEPRLVSNYILNSLSSQTKNDDARHS